MRRTTPEIHSLRTVLEDQKRPGIKSRNLVLFVDMLGFVGVTNFTGFRHSDPIPRSLLSYYGLRQLPWHSDYDGPDDVYTAFQRVIRRTIAEAQRRRKDATPLTTNLFSDSMYMVFQSPEEIVWFARRVMLRCLQAHLPVRMGIAAGTVTQHSYTSETLPNSDLVLSAPFMGTGIIRAYQAERAPQKGLRIFVHGSATYLLEEAGLQDALIQLDEVDWPPAATHEVNYLDLNSRVFPGAVLPIRIESMRKVAPRSAAKHYTATLPALRRMAHQARNQQTAGIKARRDKLRKAGGAKKTRTAQEP